MENFNEFMNGKKTITGIVILLLPIVYSLLGFDVPEGLVLDVLNGAFGLCGAVVALYGYIKKEIK